MLRGSLCPCGFQAGGFSARSVQTCSLGAQSFLARGFGPQRVLACDLGTLCFLAGLRLAGQFLPKRLLTGLFQLLRLHPGALLASRLAPLGLDPRRLQARCFLVRRGLANGFGLGHRRTLGVLPGTVGGSTCGSLASRFGTFFLPARDFGAGRICTRCFHPRCFGSCRLCA